MAQKKMPDATLARLIQPTLAYPFLLLHPLHHKISQSLNIINIQ
ncbi:hypothetical protein ABN773_23155 [Escherichia coli]